MEKQRRKAVVGASAEVAAWRNNGRKAVVGASEVAAWRNNGRKAVVGVAGWVTAELVVPLISVGNPITAK
ncbi:hypothetical protein PGRAT_05535 [Paenibacillus graminis]|uniref:Uncharacterized protein n=1 Tax=Paenibacillus graminis TaxID=189425 RepID=A0A089M6K5_9BACL|nr:hypothetical protein PGRAT_05535 [Paenibacillus graminis]